MTSINFDKEMSLVIHFNCLFQMDSAFKKKWMFIESTPNYIYIGYRQGLFGLFRRVQLCEIEKEPTSRVGKLRAKFFGEPCTCEVILKHLTDKLGKDSLHHYWVTDYPVFFDGDSYLNRKAEWFSC